MQPKKRPANKLENLQVWISPITQRIYAGYTRGNAAIHKVDITERATEAVAIMLEQSGGQLEFDNGVRLVYLPPGAPSPLYCECVDPLRILTPGGEVICDNCGKYLPKT